MITFTLVTKKGSLQLGEKVIGRVSLHPGGSWTDATSSNTTQYVYHPNNGDSTYTNAMSAAGWGVHVHQTPYSIGLSGEATFVGGGGFEFGYFSGTYDSGLYLNLYWAGAVGSPF